MATGRSISRDQTLLLRLTELLRVLEGIEAVISVSTEALRHQNCEKDADVARVLQREVGDRLSIQIEKIGTLIAGLKRPQSHTPKRSRKR